jgi:DNA-binding CsgD family transcriptional regulator
VLAGRQAELAALDAGLVNLRAGRGQLILITGEPGIGKTRLADEALERASAAGVRTARGYALDDPGAPPLWPWLRVGRDIDDVRQALADTGDIGTDAAARFGLFESVADAFTAVAKPSGVMVVLEDMHWADRTSVQLIQHLNADQARLPLLLVVTARDTQSETPWAAALPALLRGPATTSLMLTGLAAPDVEHWLRLMPDRSGWAGYAEELCARSNGNPFYISMLTAVAPAVDGADGLDRMLTRRPDLRTVINAQVADLTPDCRRTIETAAVLGDHITSPVLAATSGMTVAATRAHLAEATAAQVLRHNDDGLAFTHALVRDSVANTLSPERRAELHRAIAVALESASDPVCGAADSAATIAEHWRLATGPDAAARCVTWSRRAAGVAAKGFAHDRAVEYAQLALDRARSLPSSDGELAELTVELAERQAGASGLQEALGSCLTAADLAERGARPDVLARAALVITGVGGTDVLHVINGLCNRALTQLPLDDSVSRARVLAQLAVTEAELEHTGAADLAAQALAAAAESGDRRAELEALAALHLTLTVPETVDRREQLARRAIELGRSAEEPMAALWGHLWLVSVYFQRGELSRIQDEVASIDQLAVRRRFPLARWHIQRIEAAMAALVGEFGRAERYNDESLALATRMGDVSMIGVHHAFNVSVAAIRGETSRLGPEVVDVFRSAPQMPLVRALLVILLLQLGQRNEADDVFDQLRHLVGGRPGGTRWAPTLATIGIAAVMLEDAPTAERVYQLMLPTAGYCSGDGSGTVYSVGSNARAVADLALVAGRVEEAVGLYADAVIVNSRIGARPFVALSRLGWARALRRRAIDPSLAALRSAGDLQLAANLAKQAANEFRRLDMPGRLRAADRLLVQLTADSRKESPLTVRESEIASLLATGMSNKEIAHQLVLSERTVESHVRNILAKLELTSRAEVSRWVHRT